ncbi:lipid-binding protein [Lutibacter citreus]|uniref:lipid-binding protein n=1 Tax=Lutibacter citreus TaxID=2138210 RepID=UPI000DBE203B|nr:lipid-binding protein [Lutibacter citreus]
MKKNIIYISLILFSFTINSCNEDVEVWDSNTLNYSGTYFWELLSEDGADTFLSYDYDGQKILIYNTSDNVENEIWMEDTEHIFPLKSKFSLQGNSESFSSTSTNFDELTNNLLAVELPSSTPSASNEELVEDRDYIRNFIVEGKILSDAGTTASGNPVDSLYIKIKLLSGTVKFTSYSVPVNLRADPEVEEFAWEYVGVTYDSTRDESYVISGYRKTGFSEDDH